MQKSEYKMYLGKKLELGFGSIFFLLLTAFLVWVAIPEGSTWSLGFSVFFYFIILFPLLMIALLVPHILWGKLTFSEEGITYQTPLKTIQATWQELVGFQTMNGEIVLIVEKPGNPKRKRGVIPLFLFTRIRSGQPLQSNALLNELAKFAPHIFDLNPPV